MPLLFWKVELSSIGLDVPRYISDLPWTYVAELQCITASLAKVADLRRYIPRFEVVRGSINWASSMQYVPGIEILSSLDRLDSTRIV